MHYRIQTYVTSYVALLSVFFFELFAQCHARDKPPKQYKETSRLPIDAVLSEGFSSDTFLCNFWYCDKWRISLHTPCIRCSRALRTRWVYNASGLLCLPDFQNCLLRSFACGSSDIPSDRLILAWFWWRMRLNASDCATTFLGALNLRSYWVQEVPSSFTFKFVLHSLSVLPNHAFLGPNLAKSQPKWKNFCPISKTQQVRIALWNEVRMGL